MYVLVHLFVPEVGQQYAIITLQMNPCGIVSIIMKNYYYYLLIPMLFTLIIIINSCLLYHALIVLRRDIDVNYEFSYFFLYFFKSKRVSAFVNGSTSLPKNNQAITLCYFLFLLFVVDYLFVRSE